MNAGNLTARWTIFKVPVLVPAMEFRARVARIGGGDTALMDEILLRLLWSTTGLAIGTVRALFGLSAEQLEAFLSPLAAAEQIAVNEFGVLALTEAGRKLFEGKSGIPRLREIRFHTETVRIDQVTLQPCTWSGADRGYRALPVEVDRVPGLAALKARVQEVLEAEYDELTLVRSRAPLLPLDQPRQRSRIAFVDEVNDGRWLRHEMIVTISIDSRGASTVAFDGLAFEAQLKRRERLTEKIEEAMRAEAALVDGEQRDDVLVLLLSRGFPNCPDRIAWPDISRYFADGQVRDGDNYFSCLGRPELVAHAQASAQLEKVVRRLPLKRGEETRSAKWLVSVAGSAPFWARGNAFRNHHAHFHRRLREEDPDCKTLLLMIGKDAAEELDRDDELTGSFDEIVIFLTPIAQFQGLDVLLVPNELSQITLTSYLDRRDLFPVPYCIGSSREDWAVEATRKLIQPLLLQRTLITKRLQENEVRDILRSFVRKDPTEPGGRPKLTLRKKI